MGDQNEFNTNLEEESSQRIGGDGEEVNVNAVNPLVKVPVQPAASGNQASAKPSQQGNGKGGSYGSGSETNESVTRDREESRRRKEERERSDRRKFNSSRRDRYGSYEEDYDSFEDDTRSRHEKDTVREKRGRRDHDSRYKNSSRRDKDDWDSRSTRDSYRHQEYMDDLDDSYSRPRSRNSQYDRSDFRRERDKYRTRYNDRDDFRRRDDYDYYYGRDRDPRSRWLRDYAAPPMYPPPRGPAYGYYGYGMGGHVGQNSEVLAYLEDLRVKNPSVYRDWFNKYQMSLKDPRIPQPPIPGFNSMGSGSVNHNKSLAHNHDTTHMSHSGRSSINDEILKTSHIESIHDSQEDRFVPIESMNSIIERRMTPKKFTSGHCIGVWSPLGQLLKVTAGSTTIEIVPVRSIVKHLPEYKLLDGFPGPLIKGVSHKNTVIQFCQKKIKESATREDLEDRENFILLWELLILLLRQNGVVVGSDIAELLLQKTTDSNSEEVVEDGLEENELPETFEHNESKGTEQFTEMLLYGHKKEAVDFAMDNNLWGHALFLASKMDDRTYGQVLAKFANGLAFNHPLQTLYQIMSGKQPSFVSACVDSTFGDWKPHLAMLLSNAGERPEIENKSIMTLGETLENKGLTFAAQFCYLMAELEFSPNSKLGTLLGYSNKCKNSLEAMQMTQVYEFARTMAEPNFYIGQHYMSRKFEYVCSLINMGFAQKALSYLEEIAKLTLRLNLMDYDQSYLNSVIHASERLLRSEYQDASSQPAWLEELKNKTPSSSEEASRKTSISSATDINHQQVTPENTPATEISPGENIPNEGLDQMINCVDSPPHVPNTSDQYHMNQTNLPQSMSNDAMDGFNKNKVEETPNAQGISHPVVQGSYESSNSYELHQPMMVSPPAVDLSTQPQINGYGYNQNPDSFRAPYIPLDQSNQMIVPAAAKAPGPIPQLPQSSGSNPSYSAPPKKKTVRFEDEDYDDYLDDIEDDDDEDDIANENDDIDIYYDEMPLSDDGTSSINKLITSNILDTPLLKHSIKNELLADGLKFPELDHVHPMYSLCSASRRISTSKTFPIDRKCCEVNEPCKDHENSQSSSRSSNLKSSSLSNIEKHGDMQRPSSLSRPKTLNENKKKSVSKSGNEKQSSWISGIFSKLSLKPKNEMKLPDDKNPSIVWDEQAKRWVNLNEDEDDGGGIAGPPPKDSDLMKSSGIAPSEPVSMPLNGPSSGSQNPVLNNNQPLPSQYNHNSMGNMSQSKPPTGNIYKLQRKSLKNSYVDVLKGNSVNSGPQSQPNMPNSMNPPQLGPINESPISNKSVPNMFIPSPSIGLEDSGPVSFLTPSMEKHIKDEVTSQADTNQNAVPPMYNPSQFYAQSNSMVPPN